MLVNFTRNHTATYTTINTIGTSIIIVIILLCSFFIGITFYCIRNFLYYKSLNNNNPIIPINDGITDVNTEDNDEINNDGITDVNTEDNNGIKNDDIEITIF
jgi:hypothetical protein